MSKLSVIFPTLIFLYASTVLGQDILILKNGDEIQSKVIEVNQENIKYKKFSNLDGPLYSIDKNTVFLIKYSNGEKEVFDMETKETKETMEYSIKDDVLIDLRDNEKYKFIRYGSDLWTVENMRYRNAAYFSPNGNTYFDASYGLLYRFEEIEKICPKGWHVPTLDDWKRLFEPFKGTTAKASRQLRSDRGWGGGFEGENESRFNIPPAGFYDYSNNYYKFGTVAYEWTKEGYYFVFEPIYGVKKGHYSANDRAVSCRCVQDK